MRFRALAICSGYGGALITDDGEAIEGEALDDVLLVGVATHTISPVWVDYNPVM